MALDAPGGPTTAFRHIAASSRCLSNRDQRPGVHAKPTRSRPGEPAVRHITRRIESADAGGSRCHVETLSDQALWDAAPIQPKTSPNPLANDKEFLPHFPYLAEPW